MGIGIDTTQVLFCKNGNTASAITLGNQYLDFGT
jgi:hypothetical protein